MVKLKMQEHIKMPKMIITETGFLFLGQKNYLKIMNYLLDTIK